MLNHSFCQKLKKNIQQRKNYLCIGLDPDLNKIPDHFPKNLTGLKNFLEEVITATSDLCIAYKPNLAFFEAFGIDGITLLKQILKKIPAQVPCIIDAKRGDIGNTSQAIAQYLFDYLEADATTLHPYMGEDSLAPFFNYKDKYNFILALTSNPSSTDFQKQKLLSGDPLYLHTIKKSLSWQQKYQNIGFVIGATQTELAEIRKFDPISLFLIHGVGAQGGDYKTSVTQGKNKDGLVLINMSRQILYCSKEKNFTDTIRQTIQNL